MKAFLGPEVFEGTVVVARRPRRRASSSGSLTVDPGAVGGNERVFRFSDVRVVCADAGENAMRSAGRRPV